MSSQTTLVLLIEPTHETRIAHADALRRARFAVVAVADCTTALYAIAEVTPHVVVASLHAQTREDCLALCARLKGDPRTTAIPILLTAETIASEDLHQAAGMKVLGIAVGPDDGTKVTGAIRGVLAVPREPASVPQPAQPVGRSA